MRKGRRNASSLGIAIHRLVRFLGLTAFENRVSALPEVRNGYRVTGGSDHLLRIVVRDITHYQRVLADLSNCPKRAHPIELLRQSVRQSTCAFFGWLIP
jgi:DNA-binding Lrp family transcriptional regulator